MSKFFFFLEVIFFSLINFVGLFLWWLISKFWIAYSHKWERINHIDEFEKNNNILNNLKWMNRRFFFISLIFGIVFSMLFVTVSMHLYAHFSLRVAWSYSNLNDCPYVSIIIFTIRYDWDEFYIFLCPTFFFFLLALDLVLEWCSVCWTLLS